MATYYYNEGNGLLVNRGPPISIDEIYELAKGFTAEKIQAILQDNCPIGLLEELAHDSSFLVKEAVSLNPNINSKICEHLFNCATYKPFKIVADPSEKEKRDILLHLKDHPNCPEELRNYLKLKMS